MSQRDRATKHIAHLREAWGEGASPCLKRDHRRSLRRLDKVEIAEEFGLFLEGYVTREVDTDLPPASPREALSLTRAALYRDAARYFADASGRGAVTRWQRLEWVELLDMAEGCRRQARADAAASMEVLRLLTEGDRAMSQCRDELREIGREAYAFARFP